LARVSGRGGPSFCGAFSTGELRKLWVAVVLREETGSRIKSARGLEELDSQ